MLYLCIDSFLEALIVALDSYNSRSVEHSPQTLDLTILLFSRGPYCIGTYGPLPKFAGYFRCLFS